MRIQAALSAAAVLCLAGCAAPGPAVLRFGFDESPQGKRLMWPPEPEVPRYLYAGVLIGEANFKRPGDQTRESVAGLLAWLAGLIAGDASPVELRRPNAGVVDLNGRILITDSSRQAVIVFDPVLGKLETWERADGLTNFQSPVGIAATPDGHVFVADADLGIVVHLDASGAPLRAFGRASLRRPTGLAYDPATNELYVADTQSHDIKVFDSRGAVLRVIGRRGEAEGEFNFPTHLAFADGLLYVTDTMNSRVQVISRDGKTVQRSFGERGLYVGNLVRPKGIAVDTEGNVYVVESYHDHLLVFNRYGEFLMAIGGAGQEVGKFFLPSGVWTDRLNRVFVADMFNGRVVLFQHLGGGADGEQ